MASSYSPLPHAALDVPPRSRWAGWVVTALVVLFLIFDTAVKLLELPVAVTSTVELGYPAGAVVVIGAIEAVCLALYLWPRTALLGAVLLVGYLGGAVATHVRVGNPLFSHMLFPIFIAALLWLGLWLRSGRVRRIVREAFA